MKNRTAMAEVTRSRHTVGRAFLKIYKIVENIVVVD
jgi:hypothetical protein